MAASIGRSSISSQSPDQQYSPNDQDHVKHFVNQGLVNIGNTCFLNSALQMLYSIDQFQNYVLADSEKNSLAQNLNDVFKSMKQNGKKEQQKKCLRRLERSLSVLCDNYQIGQQQDSFDILNSIVNILGDYDKKYYELFQVAFTSKCKCINSYDHYLTRIINIPRSSPMCEACHTNQIKVFHESPQYLLCMGNKTKYEHEHSNDIYFKTKQSLMIHYQLIAKVIYTGNGHFGHYQCARKNTEAQFVLYNDNFVDYRYKSKLSEKISVFLYKKVQKQISIDQVKIQRSQNFRNRDLGKLDDSKNAVFWIIFSLAAILLLVIFIVTIAPAVFGWQNKNHIKFNISSNMKDSTSISIEANDENTIFDLYKKYIEVSDLSFYQSIDQRSFELNEVRFYLEAQVIENKSLRCLMLSCSRMKINQKQINTITFYRISSNLRKDFDEETTSRCETND